MNYNIQKQEQIKYTYLKHSYINKNNLENRIEHDKVDINYNGEFIVYKSQKNRETLIILKYQEVNQKFKFYQKLEYHIGKIQFSKLNPDKDIDPVVVFNREQNILYYFPIDYQLIVYELNEQWEQKLDYQLDYEALLSCKYMKDNQLITLIYDYVQLIKVDLQNQNVLLLQTIFLGNDLDVVEIIYDHFNQSLLIWNYRNILILKNKKKNNKWKKSQLIQINKYSDDQHRLYFGSYEISQASIFPDNWGIKYLFYNQETELYETSSLMNLKITKGEFNYWQIQMIEWQKSKRILIVPLLKRKLIKVYEITQDNIIVLKNIVKRSKHHSQALVYFMLQQNSKYFLCFRVTKIGTIYFCNIQKVSDILK